ncbi:MAG: hypothetical protein MZV64_30110 [Ignavibacteriales bacterium]|nr:hypothetical protein [Ignavibacteriales bacterium]
MLLLEDGVPFVIRSLRRQRHLLPPAHRALRPHRGAEGLGPDALRAPDDRRRRSTTSRRASRRARRRRSTSSAGNRDYLNGARRLGEATIGRLGVLRGRACASRATARARTSALALTDANLKTRVALGEPPPAHRCKADYYRRATRR